MLGEISHLTSFQATKDRLLRPHVRRLWEWLLSAHTRGERRGPGGWTCSRQAGTITD